MSRDEIELLIAKAEDARQHRIARALSELLELRRTVESLQGEVARLKGETAPQSADLGAPAPPRAAAAG